MRRGPDENGSGTDDDEPRSAGGRPAVDARRTVFRTELEPGVRPSIGVVESVAAVTGRRPSALPPLSGAVDVGALDAFVGSAGGRAGDASVSFAYASVAVVVTAAGELSLRTD